MDWKEPETINDIVDVKIVLTQQIIRTQLRHFPEFTKKEFRDTKT